MQEDHAEDEDGDREHGAFGTVVGDQPDDQQDVGRVDTGTGAHPAEDEQDREVADRIQESQRASHPKDRFLVGPRDVDHRPGVVDRHPDQDQRQAGGDFRGHHQGQDGGEHQPGPAADDIDDGQSADGAGIQARPFDGIQTQER